MTAGLTRTDIIQYAVKHGIAGYIVDNYLSAKSDQDIDHARVTIMQWAGLAAPHVAACVQDALGRADQHHAADIRDLLDIVIDTLNWHATPEQVSHAMTMRKALADMVTGGAGRGELADRIERVSAELVASLREQPLGPPVEPATGP